MQRTDSKLDRKRSRATKPHVIAIEMTSQYRSKVRQIRSIVDSPSTLGCSSCQCLLNGLGGRMNWGNGHCWRIGELEAVKNSVLTGVLRYASFVALFPPRASLPGTSERFSIIVRVNKLRFAPVGLPNRNGRLSPVKLGFLPVKLVRGAVI